MVRHNGDRILHWTRYESFKLTYVVLREITKHICTIHSNFSTPRWHRSLKSFLAEDKNLFIMYQIHHMINLSFTICYYTTWTDMLCTHSEQKTYIYLPTYPPAFLPTCLLPNYLPTYAPTHSHIFVGLILMLWHRETHINPQRNR